MTPEQAERQNRLTDAMTFFRKNVYTVSKIHLLRDMLALTAPESEAKLIADFIAHNASYCHEHGESWTDVETYKRISDLLTKRAEANKHRPMYGDAVRVVCEGGRRYEQAHIERDRFERGGFHLCTQPYTPFTFEPAEGDEWSFSASGGYWSAVMAEDLEPIGTTTKLFHVWGRVGARGNGALCIPATVNHWNLKNVKNFY